MLKLGSDPDIRCVRRKTLGDYIREDHEELFEGKITLNGVNKTRKFLKTDQVKNELNQMLYKHTLTRPSPSSFSSPLRFWSLNLQGKERERASIAIGGLL